MSVAVPAAGPESVQPDSSGGLEGVGVDAGAAAATPTPLGINTNFAAALPSDSLSRLEKWELQSYSRQLLPKERIRFCCLSRIPGRKGVEVYHSPAHQSAHYGGLITCGSVWLCPVCAARIAERRRELLARAVESCRRDRGQVWLVSYTFRHRRADRLGAVLEGFLAAQRWMSGSRAYKRALTRYGVVGTVKALEVTWGRANGWHPHAHALLVGPAEVEPAAVEEELYRAWMPAAHRFG
ncbi:MAG: protein rep, partial [Thermomicrobiales bacterium]